MTETAVRLTVSEAAEQLGISAEAIRQRISRNTIRHTKIGTTVYVELGPDQIRHNKNRNQHDNNQTALIQSLQEQITYLRHQLDTAHEANREMRRLLAGLTQRIPELAAADTEKKDDATGQGHESHENPAQATSQPAARVADQQPSQSTQGGFWRRLFGG